jgi:hypothetical protein
MEAELTNLTQDRSQWSYLQYQIVDPVRGSH